MINHGFILILGALALIAIHVFRPRHVNREHTFVILGGAAIGFLIVVLVTSLVIWSFDLVRGTELDSDIARFEIDPSDRRLEVLIVASSHSAESIDDKRLETALAKAGFPYAVRALTAGGFFAFDQDVMLDEYLSKTDRIPIAVMIEVGTEYKIAIDPNKQNKAAGVRFIDMKRAGLGIVHLLNADWPLATKIESIWSIIRHVIFKTVHTGFASQAVAWGEALPEKGFHEIVRPHPRFTREFADRISAGDVIAQSKIAKIPNETLKWREDQKSNLPRKGVRHSIYFTPPILNIRRRAFQKAICDRAPVLDCIDSTSADLMKELSFEHWYDDGHVLLSGAHIYTDWLAERLIKQLGSAPRQ